MGDKIKVPNFHKEGFKTTKADSRRMAKIKGNDTIPEIRFRKKLWKNGYRYRVNYNKLIGKPDIALLKYKVLIFIDGEFWHGFDWEYRKKRLKGNKEFWIAKIERNMQRDMEVNEALSEKGLRSLDSGAKKFLRIWMVKLVKYLSI